MERRYLIVFLERSQNFAGFWPKFADVGASRVSCSLFLLVEKRDDDLLRMKYDGYPGADGRSRSSGWAPDLRWSVREHACEKRSPSSPRHSESMRNYCRGEFGDHYPRKSESKILHAVISFF